MKCPKCKKKIEKVDVISECTQDAVLEEKALTSFENTEVGITLKVECRDCGSDITEFLEKKGVDIS